MKKEKKSIANFQKLTRNEMKNVMAGLAVLNDATCKCGTAAPKDLPTGCSCNCFCEGYC